eukprot:scaffold8599_cov110-Isochrysis_galbana.AAC.10
MLCQRLPWPVRRSAPQTCAPRTAGSSSRAAAHGTRAYPQQQVPASPVTSAESRSGAPASSSSRARPRGALVVATGEFDETGSPGCPGRRSEPHSGQGETCDYCS